MKISIILRLQVRDLRVAFIFDRDIPSFRLDIPFNRIGGDTITIQYKFWNFGFGSSAGRVGGIEPEE